MDMIEITPEQLKKISKDFDGTRDSLSKILLTDFPNARISLIHFHDWSKFPKVITGIHSAYFTQNQAKNAKYGLDKIGIGKNVDYHIVLDTIKNLHEGQIILGVEDPEDAKLPPLDSADLDATYNTLLNQIPL